jgi:hypothetical protein
VGLLPLVLLLLAMWLPFAAGAAGPAPAAPGHWFCGSGDPRGVNLDAAVSLVVVDIFVFVIRPCEVLILQVDGVGLEVDGV